MLFLVVKPDAVSRPFRARVPNSCQVWVPVEIQARDHEVRYKLFVHRRQLLLCRLRSIAQEGHTSFCNSVHFSPNRHKAGRLAIGAGDAQLSGSARGPVLSKHWRANGNPPK
jgi:hypothetical protein